MIKLEVFDPPMCCTTGICGSSADPTLVTFASDLEWLKAKGVEIERHNISLTPTEFKKNKIITRLIEREGNSILPVLLVGESIVAKSIYPSRKKLAKICNIQYTEDEAPPIHREENCCCGVDCDCRNEEITGLENLNKNCDCSNSPAETNCSCDFESEFEKIHVDLKNFLLIILALIAFGVIILKYFM